MKNFILRAFSLSILVSIMYASYYFYNIYGLSLILFFLSLQVNRELHSLLFSDSAISKVFYYSSFLLSSIGLFAAYMTPIYLAFPVMLSFSSLCIVLSFFEAKKSKNIQNTLNLIFKSLFLIVYFVFGAVSCIRLISSPMGISLFLIMLLIAGSSDIFAYLGGNFFKGPKLLVYISPNKSISGAISGLVMSFFIGLFAFKYFFPELTFATSIPFLILVAVIAQVGDLIASALKRSCGEKNSGTFLPGHGGLLDRVDSILLISPLFFFLSWILVYIIVKT